MGVLLLGPEKGVYWYGARLSIAGRRSRPTTTRPRCRSGAVLRRNIWAIENPQRGLSSRRVDFARVLEICRPYLGDVVGVWATDALAGSRAALPEDLDRDDPGSSEYPGGRADAHPDRHPGEAGIHLSASGS